MSVGETSEVEARPEKLSGVNNSRSCTRGVTSEFLENPKFSSGLNYSDFSTPAVMCAVKKYEISDSANLLHLGGDGFFRYSEKTFDRIRDYENLARAELEGKPKVGCYHNLLAFSGFDGSALMVAPYIKGYPGLINAYGCVAGRQLLPKPNRIDIETLRPWYYKFMCEYFEKGPIVPYEFNAWNHAFPGGRRKQQLNCQRRITKLDNKITAFVKNELTSLNTVRKGKEFRCVSSYDHNVNVLVGPYWKSISKYVSSVLTIDEKFTYGCKLTGEEAGLWLTTCKEEGYAYFYKGDYSRWDGRHHYMIIQLLMDLIHEWWYVPTEICEIDNGQIRKRGVFRYLDEDTGTWYFTENGTTPSGAQWTSSLNSLSGLMIVYAYMRIHKFRWKVMQNGDDLVFASRKVVEVQQLVDWITKLTGMCLEAEECSEINFTFCSKLFWPLNDKYVLSALPGRQLAKFGWNTREFDDIYTYVNGLYQSTYTSYSYIPVLRSYLRLFEKLYGCTYQGTGITGTDIYKYRCQAIHSTDENIVSFFIDRYCTGDYSWADVVAVEKLIESVESFPCLIHHDFINHMIALDAST